MIMRRFIVALLACVIFATSAYGAELQTYQIRNTSGDYLTTNMPTTTIVPRRDRLYGFSIMPANKDENVHSELVISIRDVVPDGSGGTVAEVIVEAEATENTGTTVWLPFGKTIYTQLSISQGPNSEVLLYYGR